MAAVTSVVYYHNIETSNFPKLLIGREAGGARGGGNRDFDLFLCQVLF